MSEWNYLDLPYTSNVQYTVLMDNLQHRECKSDAIGQLFFTDCTHPLQQSICDRRKIVKWQSANSKNTAPILASISHNCGLKNRLKGALIL